MSQSTPFSPVSSSAQPTPITSATSPVVTSPTSDFAPASTFTPGQGGNGGGGGQNGAGFSSGPSIASSASLYLYTFLATLVLLLSVSAAIVIRSFLLRRRHRAMMEEAIRNGTWIAPLPGMPGANARGGANKVDLSKKPRMWEAYLGSQGKRWRVQGRGRDSMLFGEGGEGTWEGVLPFAAVWVGEKEEKGEQEGGVTASSNAMQGTTADPDAPRVPVQARARNVLRSFGRMISPASTSPTSPLPASPASPATDQPTNGSSTHLPLGSTPGTLRVAVLIAMPSPRSSSHYPSSSSAPSSLPHPLAASSSSSSHPTSHPLSPVEEHDEEPLPHLEMGVAELPIVAPPSEHAELGVGTGEVSRKESLGSRESV